MDIPLTIFDESRAITKLFGDLQSQLQGVGEEDMRTMQLTREVVESWLQEPCLYFKAWATSIAALHRPQLRSSLDFRLQDSQHIKDQILTLLSTLNDSLIEAQSIICQAQINEWWEEEEPPITQIEIQPDGTLKKIAPRNIPQSQAHETCSLNEILSSAQGTVSSLLRLSITIRASPVRNDYSKADSRYDMSAFWDIQHVQEKHGNAKYSQPWLLEKLGKAITLRRKYLKYREDHNHKILSRNEGLVSDGHTIALTANHTLPSTVATGVAASNQPILNKDYIELEETAGSQTTYDPTLYDGEGTTTLTVPKPPEWAFEGILFDYGNPFICPYCFTEQNCKDRISWKKHVFRDLKPQHEWFLHEIQKHRREWVCQFCQCPPFKSSSAIRNHLLAKHSSIVTKEDLPEIITLSEEPVNRSTVADCHLCDDWANTFDGSQHGDLQKLRKHLGRHLQQLALFALPRAEIDEDDSAEDGEIEDDPSHNSKGTQEREISVEEAEILNQRFADVASTLNISQFISDISESKSRTEEPHSWGELADWGLDDEEAEQDEEPKVKMEHLPSPAVEEDAGWGSPPTGKKDTEGNEGAKSIVDELPKVEEPISKLAASQYAPTDNPTLLKSTQQANPEFFEKMQKLLEEEKTSKSANTAAGTKPEDEETASKKDDKGKQKADTIADFAKENRQDTDERVAIGGLPDWENNLEEKRGASDIEDLELIAKIAELRVEENAGDKNDKGKAKEDTTVEFTTDDKESIRIKAAREAAVETTRTLAEEKAAWEKRLKEEIENAKKAAEAVKKKAEEKAAQDKAKTDADAELAKFKEEAAEAKKEANKALDNLKTPPPRDDRKPIRFKDAVGRKFSFPFHLCATWAGMEELIKNAFEHVETFGPLVQNGHYDLIGPNGEIILPQVWEATIQPDWSITMHMWPFPEPNPHKAGPSTEHGPSSERMRERSNAPQEKKNPEVKGGGMLGFLGGRPIKSAGKRRKTGPQPVQEEGQQ
ncbi:hypothetical protein VTL71DRAFT_5069 [Oculimacula yallundae]|uniref:C2H2-type domain-containing protein n=1 Tax=Oculimacula yallundae TaxID=86028 RepID=A0ABR4C032_9HELO